MKQATRTGQENEQCSSTYSSGWQKDSQLVECAYKVIAWISSCSIVVEAPLNIIRSQRVDIEQQCFVWAVGFAQKVLPLRFLSSSLLELGHCL